MLEAAGTYDELYAGFRWRIPERFNIASAACDRFALASPHRTAVVEDDPSGAMRPITYGQLREDSIRLAALLRQQGVKAGDRIAILLPQGRHVPVAHFAAYRLGAIAVPIAALFGVDALTYRLNDSGARALITDATGVAKYRRIEAPLPELQVVISSDGADGDVIGLPDPTGAVPDLETRDTGPDDPALMIYTSGTTGQPKGALHGHRVLLGHLPGVQMPHEFLPQPDDRLWTPADWAWAGGLLNILLPGLYFGVPVVARKFEKFDAEEAFALMARHGVRNTFIPPTALRMLRGVERPRERYDLKLRTIGSGGETLGAETLQWGREALGLTINEFYGQTECNLVLSSCGAIGVVRPGTIGKPVPGHQVVVIDGEGRPCPPDEIGQVAVRRPDPVMFLEYWRRPEATRAKFLGDWMLTGDQGSVDADGYIRFLGRDDDVITSAGYRIGPGEIEDCLIRHPAVALAAVVGKPDPVRTEIVKAFVVLRDGFRPSETIVEDIKSFVRTRLSAHEYPREIAFMEDLPMTTTGKIIRRALREMA